MNNKEIYLSLLPKYGRVVNQFIESTKFENVINYDENNIEIKIKVNDSQVSSQIGIVRDLTNMIIKLIQDVILKEHIHKSYGIIYKENENDIYEKSKEIFADKEVLIRESIFYNLNNYISNNNHIDIDGFVKFRMKDLISYIYNICDIALEEYLIKRDYDEFINVLRYFTKVQESKIDTLKVYIRKDSSFILYDKNNNIIHNENDEELMNMFIKENLNYEDFLISTLLSLCPKHIKIYDSLKTNSSREVIETIKSIFQENVEEDNKS